MERKRIPIPHKCLPERLPNESYTVQIDLNQDDEPIDINCEEFIEDIDLGPDDVFELNGGDPIEADNGICN